jgi:ADP-heptose:LPS heptosyltransferase
MVFGMPIALATSRTPGADSLFRSQPMAGISDAIKAAEKQLRGALRGAANRTLAVFTSGRSRTAVRLDPSDVRRILVVRMNGRMGNTLFLTPLLSALHDVMPNAAIDVFSTYPDAADLLRGMPGLRKVMTLPHKGWWRLGTSLATLRSFRANRYDLAVDPQVNSSGGRIALVLARARWRLGFGSDQQWLRLDYSADVPSTVRHEALRPLALLQQAFDYRVDQTQPHLRVANSPEELAAGARLLEKSTHRGALQPGGGTTVIGFFASARGKKDLGPDWWREFWQAYLALQPGTVPLEVLPSASHPPVMPDFATVHCRSPRELAATIGHADWFFSADTGPMHLASAAGVPTIAFFENSDPSTYGPINRNDVALGIGGMTAHVVAEECARIVAAGVQRSD